MQPGLVLISDARVVGVPVRDGGEPLVDLRAVPRLRIDPRKHSAAGGWHWARHSLAERLAAAAQSLPDELELLIVEAYRAPSRQQEYWEHYCDQLRNHYPGLNDERLYDLASRWVAPPDVAPHCTGGAVDLTLCDADGRELDLGTPLDATPEQSDGACYTAAPVPEPAATNRSTLVRALGGAGLVNYPTEWWHWSYGERYWAFMTGADHAPYAPIAWPE